MGVEFLDPLLATGPWAAVLVICAPLAAIMVMFVCALVLVPRNRRVEAIRAMAKLVRALPSARGRRRD
jgi:hypothetical protein